MLKPMRLVTDRLIGLSTFIGSAGLLFEVSIILIDVIGRSFGAPLTGAMDISQMTMSIVVFGGMALSDKMNSHITVDILEKSMSNALNHYIDIIVALIGAVLFFLLAYAVYDSSKISQMLNLSTNVIYLPKAYFQWAVSGFALLTSLTMALRMIELIVAGPLTHHESHQENSL